MLFWQLPEKKKKLGLYIILFQLTKIFYGFNF